MKDHNCLIIGGTGGIGLETARELAADGLSIFLHGRNPEKTRKVAEELTRLGSPHVRTIIQSLENRDDIVNFCEKLSMHASQIDIVICSFGPMDMGSIEQSDYDHIQNMFDMNLLLPTFLIRTFAGQMRLNSWGRFIFFGGTGTDQNKAYRKIAHYSAAKYGLNSIVRSAAAEFSGTGLTFNIISPGYIKTEYYSAKEEENLKKRGKLLEPRRISDIIKFLICPTSSAISGSVLNAGGGLEW